MRIKRTINKESMNEIFWTRVDKSLGENECWNWTYIKDKDGYGRFKIGGKEYKSHRYSWELENKQIIPMGLFVLHSCIGNTSCVNPKHLRIGTQKENMHDAVLQGRHINPEKSGEENGNSILTNIQREEIKNIRKENSEITLNEIGKMFGVSRGSIVNIVGRKYKQYSTLQRKEVLELNKNNISYDEISKIVGLSEKMIKYIIKRELQRRQ